MCLISSLLDWISEESEPMECPVKEGYMTVRCARSARARCIGANRRNVGVGRRQVNGIIYAVRAVRSPGPVAEVRQWPPMKVR